MPHGDSGGHDRNKTTAVRLFVYFVPPRQKSPSRQTRPLSSINQRPNPPVGIRVECSHAWMNTAALRSLSQLETSRQQTADSSLFGFPRDGVPRGSKWIKHYIFFKLMFYRDLLDAGSTVRTRQGTVPPIWALGFGLWTHIRKQHISRGRSCSRRQAWQMQKKEI